MKRLIATDFDGTFYRGHEIDPADRKGIAAWRKAGNYFGFVTGRGVDFFDTAKELDLPVDYMLLYNGAMLAKPDGTVIKEYLLPRALMAELSAFFAALGTAEFFDKPDERPFYHQYYATCPSPEVALQAAAKVNARFGDRVTAFVNGPHVNIGKKGSSKSQGVFDALAYFGLPADAAAVFGDDFNDIEMLQAHNGWAVRTPRPEVRAQVPQICDSVGKTALLLLQK